MNTRSQRASTFGLLFRGIAFALPLLVGCGTSAYRERMETRLQELRDIQANQPSVTPLMLYDYIQENQLQGEKRFNLRIPRVFSANGAVFHEQSVSQITSKKFPPVRLWPLGVQVPGYFWTYEAFIPDGATKPISGTPAEQSIPASQLSWSYSFCFGAKSLAEDEASAELFEYLDGLNAALAKTPNATPAQIDLDAIHSTKDVEITSLAGGETVAWKVIHQEADMYFMSYKGRQENALVKKRGVLEIYTTYTKEQLVILAATWVKGMESATLMQAFLPVVASSVRIAEDGNAPPVQ